MAAPLNLPGFAYDPIKNRYYRVTDSTTTTGTTSQTRFSSAALKNKKNSKKTITDPDFPTLSGAKCPSSASAFEKAMYGVSDMPYGEPYSAHYQSRILGSGLRLHRTFPTAGFTVSHAAHVYGPGVFILGDETGQVIVTKVLSDFNSYESINNYLIWDGKEPIAALSVENLELDSGEVIVLAVTQGRGLTMPKAMVAIAGPERCTITKEFAIPSHMSDAFCSLISPVSRSLYLGGTRGIMTLDYEHSHHKHIAMSSDVLSLAPQPIDHRETIAAGLRNGEIRLYDIQTSDRPLLTLNHGSAVVSMEALNSHELVAAGTNNLLKLYDTRYAKHEVLKYHGYTNEYHLDISVSVNSRAEVLAVSNKNSVQMFAAQNGQAIENKQLSKHLTADESGDVVGLAWTTELDGLLVVKKNKITLWELLGKNLD